MSALSFVAEATADVLRQAAREIATPTAQAASDEAVALVFSPATLAARVTAAIAEIPDLDKLATVAESGLTLPAVPVTTANRRIQAANQAALVDLVRGAATVELARRTAAKTWNDRVSAAADRDRVNGLLDAVSARADTGAFAALRAVRAAIEAHRGSTATFRRPATSRPATGCRDRASCHRGPSRCCSDRRRPDGRRATPRRLDIRRGDTIPGNDRRHVQAAGVQP